MNNPPRFCAKAARLKLDREIAEIRAEAHESARIWTDYHERRMRSQPPRLGPSPMVMLLVIVLLSFLLAFTVMFFL